MANILMQSNIIFCLDYFNRLPGGLPASNFALTQSFLHTTFGVSFNVWHSDPSASLFCGFPSQSEYKPVASWCFPQVVSSQTTSLTHLPTHSLWLPCYCSDTGTFLSQGTSGSLRLEYSSPEIHGLLPSPSRLFQNITRSGSFSWLPDIKVQQSTHSTNFLCPVLHLLLNTSTLCRFSVWLSSWKHRLHEGRNVSGHYYLANMCLIASAQEIANHSLGN